MKRVNRRLVSNNSSMEQKRKRHKKEDIQHESE